MSDADFENSAFQANLMQRLRSAEGHLRDVSGMVESGADCESVMRQVLAVQGALREISQLMLRHHLAECLGQKLPGATIDPAAGGQWVAEIVNLYELYNRSIPWSERLKSCDRE